MHIVGHELIKKHVKHCQRGSFPLVVSVVLWVTEWVGCFRRLDLNKSSILEKSVLASVSRKLSAA